MLSAAAYNVVAQPSFGRIVAHRLCLTRTALYSGVLTSVSVGQRHNLARFTSCTRHHAGPTEKELSQPVMPATATFDLMSSNGSKTRIHVRPSYAHKPKAVENLLKQLPGLLTEAGMPAGTIASFSTQGWDLDESGDTIHRYVSLRSVRDLERVLSDINIAAKQLSHDPHTYVDRTFCTISCTTHVPPGLSMKDVKLAKQIDEILESWAVDYTGSKEIDEAEILFLRQRGRERNMEAIRAAKLDCSCG